MGLSFGLSGAIVDALGEPPPDGGNYTPMAQSLEAAGHVPELAEVGRRNYVLLLTDGWQWCDPHVRGGGGLPDLEPLCRGGRQPRAAVPHRGCVG
jgi:hypothetical protein